MGKPWVGLPKGHLSNLICHQTLLRDIPLYLAGGERSFRQEVGVCRWLLTQTQVNKTKNCTNGPKSAAYEWRRRLRSNMKYAIHLAKR